MKAMAMTMMFMLNEADGRTNGRPDGHSAEGAMGSWGFDRARLVLVSFAPSASNPSNGTNS